MAHTFPYFGPPGDDEPSDWAGASTGIEKNDFQIATIAIFTIPATKRSMPVTVNIGLRSVTTAAPIRSRPSMVMATEIVRAWATALARFVWCRITYPIFSIEPHT